MVFSSTNTLLCCIATFLGFLVSQGTAACIQPTGISNPTKFSPLPPNSPAPDDSIFFAHITIAIPQLAAFETPVQFHKIQSIVATLFNTMGAFEEKPLDVWGRQPPVRFCRNSTNFHLYRSVTLAYICSMAFKAIFPDARDQFDALVIPWGIDPQLCETQDCNNVKTPWGNAYMRLREYQNWSSRDGWNMDGSLSRSFNRIPFQDWSANRFIPRNTPWKLHNPRRWQPLLEHDGRGFLLYQEHVTPHIGNLGRSFLIDDKTYCSLTAPNPRYNYAKELNLLISRSAMMAENATTKAKIELFDDKANSLLVLQASLAFTRGIHGDSWEFIVIDMVATTTLYEAVMLVWKEKIRHNAIRPPSRMRHDRGGRIISAYAGPNQGRKSLPAREWEAYIRTMPHAEYPSGSSCFCESFAKAMTLQFGSDTFMARGEVVKLPLVLQKGSSRAETGLPLLDVTLGYSRWSEVSRDCGQSRLDGGMHFTKAVPAGAQLCAPVAGMVHDGISKLVQGSRPMFVQEFHRKLVRRVRCRMDFAGH